MPRFARNATELSGQIFDMWFLARDSRVSATVEHPMDDAVMPPRPAYLLVTARVSDPVKMGAYARALAASGLYARYGGHYLFIGKPVAEMENWPAGQSIVCAHFPSRAAAEAFWTDAQYQNDIKPLRDGAGDFHIAIFEGA
jgi:uncharacterized protein (DUF1330 family)